MRMELLRLGSFLVVAAMLIAIVLLVVGKWRG